MGAVRGWGAYGAQGCRRPLTYDFMKNVVEGLGRKVRTKQGPTSTFQ